MKGRGDEETETDRIDGSQTQRDRKMDEKTQMDRVDGGNTKGSIDRETQRDGRDGVDGETKTDRVDGGMHRGQVDEEKETDRIWLGKQKGIEWMRKHEWIEWMGGGEHKWIEWMGKGKGMRKQGSRGWGNAKGSS